YLEKANLLDNMLRGSAIFTAVGIFFTIISYACNKYSCLWITTIPVVLFVLVLTGLLEMILFNAILKKIGFGVERGINFYVFVCVGIFMTVPAIFECCLSRVKKPVH
ncbi:hypothetical protein MHBO_004016, partial [Bonamia ostreae]